MFARVPVSFASIGDFQKRLLKWRVITVSFIPEAVPRPRVLLAGGSMGNGCESLAEPERLHPELIVLDISVPGLQGLEAAQQLKRAGAAQCSFTRHAERLGQGAYRTRAATAYVIKACLSSDLVTAIFEALGEDRFVSPTISLAENP